MLVRLLQQAEVRASGGAVIKYHNHQRVAKKRMRAIVYARGMDKKARLYRGLIEVTKKSLGYVEVARDVQYGNKIDLSAGCSGLVLDVVIAAGKP